MPTTTPGLVDVDYRPEVTGEDYFNYDRVWLAACGTDVWTREIAGSAIAAWRGADGKLLAGPELVQKAFANYDGYFCHNYSSFVQIDSNIATPRRYFTFNASFEGMANAGDAANFLEDWTVQIELPPNFNFLHVSLWAHFCQNPDPSLAEPANFCVMAANVTVYADDKPMSFAIAVVANDFSVAKCDLSQSDFAPGGDTPGGDTPGGDEPGGDTPGGDTPGGDTPGADTPGGDTPGADTPGGDTPGDDTPGDDTPGDDTPGDDTPGDDTPGDDTPGDDEPTPPSEDDKYYDPDDRVNVRGDEEFTSPAGQDTWFLGTFGGTDGMTENTVINAGADANNSLVMDISSDWLGFAGVTQDGTIGPSVTNVGRVVVNNDGAARDSLEFNAKNISTDVERFDVNNNGKGAVSLTNLPVSVGTINIKGINAVDGVAPATAIDFAAAPNLLLVGLEDVCANADGSAPINVNGVRELEIVSHGAANSVNLKGSAGVEKLILADDPKAALTITDSDGSTIREYDASAMTGNVNIGVSNFQDGSVVQGGSGGADALTFADNVQIDQARWDGIEELVFKEGGDVDVSMSSGISKLVQDGNRELNVSNLDVERLEVVVTENAEMGLARTCAIMRAQGKIGDVSWSTHGTTEFGSELTADFVCDAAGDAYITMSGKDRLGVSSVFEFRQMTGTLTIDDPNPTDPDAYLDSSIMGVKLQAENATGLNITHTGSMKICGALWKVENVVANMTDYKDAGVNGLLKLPELPSAGNVEINSDRMDIYISGLGSENNARNMEVAIHDAADVHIDEIRGAGPISAAIDSYGNVEIGSIKTSGALELTVSGVNITATQNDYNVNDGFIAAGLNIDFGEIYGSVGSATMLIDLEARGGALNYTGARGSDNLLVGALTGGTRSTLNTGAGADEVVIQTLKSIGAGQTATLDVDLGAGYDILRVYSMNQAGNLIVNVAGGDSLIGSVITYECPFRMEINSVDAANAALDLIGAGFQLDAGAAIADGVFEHGGNAYWIGNRIADGASNVTLVVAEGADAGIFVADDLAGV